MPSKKNDHSALCTLHSAFCTRAFTLIEMLTVIAIIGVLAGILIPTVQVAMRKARIATASGDVKSLFTAATSYSLDFGAFPPDCTAFFSTQDNPFPGTWNNLAAPYNTPLCPNELLMWYLTMQYSTGSPATGYPYNWSSPPAYNTNGDWNSYPSNPSLATAVFARVSAGPYFDLKAKQKTDVNANGYCEFMDPWGRPYMYRAYPQSASVQSASSLSGSGPWTVTLTLSNLGINPNPTYNGYTFYTASNLANQNGCSTTGSIQLSGFSPAGYNGTFTFQATPYNSGSNSNCSQVNVTFSTNPNPSSVTVVCGQYTFPLHNKQTCDIYSLGPYGVTRAMAMPSGGEWKPVNAATLNLWPQVWGTPGDGNDISANSGNTIVNSLYQDNICNW